MSKIVSSRWWGLRVLVVAPTEAYGGFNTSMHRVSAMRKLGCRLVVVDTSAESQGRVTRLYTRVANALYVRGFPVALPDSVQVRERLVDCVSRDSWDIIWLEKALTVEGRTITAIREKCPGAKIVGFSLDDMSARHNRSLQFVGALPQYDLFVTNKSFNVDELQALGCPKVVFLPNSFDPEVFFPVAVTKADIHRLGGDVGFIGTYEGDRAQIVHYLAQQGCNVRVWGSGWSQCKLRHPGLKIEDRPLYGPDLRTAMAAFKINLAFLRKLNRDQQTTRSVEIPACGGFMLAERTREHCDLFREGEEAEFFESSDELLLKIKWYLERPSARRAIAAAGRERCLQSGYTHVDRLNTIFSLVV